MGDDEPTDRVDDFMERVRGELTGRMDHARGDIKRTNALMREFFEAVELVTTDRGVRIAPLLSVQAAERIMRGLPWSHGVTVNGQPSEVLGVDDQGMTWLTLPDDARPGDDRLITIPDPPPLETMTNPDANPHTPT